MTALELLWLMHAEKDGITLRKLGQFVGLQPSLLSGIEKGRRLPPKDDEKIENIALILGIDQEDFVNLATKERRMQRPKVLERLFQNEPELAWGFFRATENATDEQLKDAFERVLNELKNQGG